MRQLSEALKSQVMREMGAKGGRTVTSKPKGFAKMTPKRRREISRMAVAARRKKAT